jgi:leader peptidase (prepilin peptidase) / N-methyltransferase
MTCPHLHRTLIPLSVVAITRHEPGCHARATIGAAARTASTWPLHWIRPGGMGLGNAKLAVSIGLLLGWASWQALITGTFAGFALAAHRATRATQLPLAPFILLGALVAIAVLRV